jgi:hypothetical protein
VESQGRDRTRPVIWSQLPNRVAGSLTALSSPARPTAAPSVGYPDGGVDSPYRTHIQRHTSRRLGRFPYISTPTR